MKSIKPPKVRPVPKTRQETILKLAREIMSSKKPGIVHIVESTTNDKGVGIKGLLRVNGISRRIVVGHLIDVYDIKPSDLLFASLGNSTKAA